MRPRSDNGGRGVGKQAVKRASQFRHRRPRMRCLTARGHAAKTILLLFAIDQAATKQYVPPVAATLGTVAMIAGRRCDGFAIGNASGCLVTCRSSPVFLGACSKSDVSCRTLAPRLPPPCATSSRQTATPLVVNYRTLRLDARIVWRSEGGVLS